MMEYLNIIKTGDCEDNTLNFIILNKEKLTFSYEG